MHFDHLAFLTAFRDTPAADAWRTMTVATLALVSALLWLRVRATRGNGKPSRSAWFDEV